MKTHAASEFVPVWIGLLLLIGASDVLFGGSDVRAAEQGTDLGISTATVRMEFSERSATPNRWEIRKSDANDGDSEWHALIDPAAILGRSAKPLHVVGLSSGGDGKTTIRYALLGRGESAGLVYIEFESEPRVDGLVVKKRFELKREGYELAMTVSLRATGLDSVPVGNGVRGLGVTLGPGLGFAPSRRKTLAVEGRDYRVYAVLKHGDALSSVDVEPDAPFAQRISTDFGRLEWIALYDSEDILAMKPEAGVDATTGFVVGQAGIRDLSDGVSKEAARFYPIVQYFTDPLVVEPGLTKSLTFNIFGGPKARSALETADIKLEGVFYHHLWGWLADLCIVLERLLTWMAGLIGNWGLALILFAILIRVVGLPLTLYGARNQAHVKAAMEQVNPLVAEIKETYRDDPEVRDEKIFALYKQYGVNPAAHFKGCLPVLVQIPFLIALFQILLYSPELPGKSFLWIDDLTLPDHLFSLGIGVPWLGSYFNLLPFLMFAVQSGIAAIVRQSAPDGSQYRGVRLRLSDLSMPAVITILFYPFPAGCLLFWTTGNVMQLFEQIWVRHR